jgi:hypothetical protein
MAASGMEKRTMVFLVLAILVLFSVIILPSLNSKEAMTYAESVSKWTHGKFVLDSDT